MTDERYCAKAENTNEFITLRAELGKAKKGIPKASLDDSLERSEGLEDLMNIAGRAGFYVYDTSITDGKRPYAVMVCITDKNYEGITAIMKEVIDRYFSDKNKPVLFLESDVQGLGFLLHELPFEADEEVQFDVRVRVDKYGDALPHTLSDEKRRTYLTVPKEHYLPALFNDIVNKEIKITVGGPESINEHIDLKVASQKREEIEEFYKQHEGKEIRPYEAKELTKMIKLYLAAQKAKVCSYVGYLKDMVCSLKETTFAVVDFETYVGMTEGLNRERIQYIAFVQKPENSE